MARRLLRIDRTACVSTAVNDSPTRNKRSLDMPTVTQPLNKKGDFLVDYEEKVFEDVKAKPGEKALVTFHTVAFEGSIGWSGQYAASNALAA